MKVQFNFGMSHFPCKHCVTSCFFCLCNNGENRSYLRFRRSIGFSPFSFAWSVCLAPFFHSIDLWAKAQGFLEQPTNTKSTHAETSPSTEMSSNHSWRLKKSGEITFLQTALPCTCPVLSEGEALFVFFTFDTHRFQIGHFCFNLLLTGIVQPRSVLTWHSFA